MKGYELITKRVSSIGAKVLKTVLCLFFILNHINPMLIADAAQALKDGRAEDYNSNQYYHIDILVNADYEYKLTFSQQEKADHADIVIEKKWNNVEGVALPESVTVEVMKEVNGVSSLAQTVTLTADDNWTTTLENLPMEEDGYAISYSVSEADVKESTGAWYESIVTTVESSLKEKQENVMVYTEDDKTITFYYDETAPHININGTAYPYSTANWELNSDGTYSLVFTYSKDSLTYTSTWIYDPINKVYTYISDDYMVVDEIDYVTYISTSGVEKVLYDRNNYVPEVTAVTRDAKDNEVARDYYYFEKQADAYRDDVYYSQEFWSTNRAIEDMPTDTTIRVGYDYTYGYFDKFGLWHSDSSTAEQIFDTGSDKFTNICDNRSKNDTQRGFDVVLQLSDAMMYLGDGVKYTYDVDITNTPVSSLVLSKTVSNASYMPNGDQKFTFTITLDEFLDKKIDGTFETIINDSTMSSIAFIKGVATVELGHGDVLKINGLPAGLGYSITENVPENYHAESSTLTGVTGVGIAEFVNTYQHQYGDLKIEKLVTHSLGTDYVMPAMTFTINAKLTDEKGAVLANQKFEVKYSDSTETSEIMTDSEGKITVSLKHGESVEIYNLPAGTKVEISESDVPTGFVPTVHPSNTVTIAANADAEVVVQNVYSPSSVNVKIDLSGEKTLKDKDGNVIPLENWTNEVFTFALQKYVDGAWVTIATDTATKDDPTIDFMNSVELTFTEIGVYEYQVIEKNHGQTIDGVTYDSTFHTFHVVVTDANMDGVLESRVESTHGTNVNGFVFNETANTWENNSINFTNQIRNDMTSVTLMVQKNVEGYSKAGFQFELYKTDASYQIVEGTPLVTGETDDAGETYWTFNYEYKPIGSNTITEYYILKEKASGITGMQDSKAVYKFKVEITGDNGAIKAGIIAEHDTPFATYTESVVIGDKTETVTYPLATFTNVYKPIEVEWKMNITKNYNGVTLVSDNDFQFEVYEVTSYDSSTGNMTLSDQPEVVEWDNGFVYSETYTAAGTYYYKVIEKIPAEAVQNADGTYTLDGVTYDNTVYYIRVDVVDNNGQLEATKTILNHVTADVVFNNTSETNYDLVIKKIVSYDDEMIDGYILEEGAFNFTMHEVDDKGNILAGGLTMHSSNNSNGEVVFEDITYTKAGEYYYQITENQGTR